MATESLPEPTPGSAPRPELEPRRGMRLGRYELHVPIASGGMAQVWIAEQRGELGFRRLVALKMIRPEHAASASFRRMFLDEARIAATIRHANVVEVLDLGEEGPLVFQAMPLIEGDSVAGLVRRWRARREGGGLPPGHATRILADALRGLHAAHELTDDEGVPLVLVHRDVSPQNILVGIDGSAKIADFGIAKALGRLSDETEAGQVKGKFSYMAPEQVERRPPDRRSDVFSAGIVLWEALTGARLFRGDDVIDTLMRVQQLRVPNPRELAREIPLEIADVTMRALERDPAQRFQTAAELADALEEAALVARVAVSQKDVAQLVWELAGAHVERQREAVRACRGGTLAAALPEIAPPAPTITADAMHTATIAEPRPTARRPWLWAALALLVAGGGAIAFAAATRDRSETGSSVRAPSAAPVEAAPQIATAHAEPQAATATVATSAAAATASAPAASTAAGTAKATRTIAAPLPRATAAKPAQPQPRFGNPY